MLPLAEDATLSGVPPALLPGASEALLVRCSATDAGTEPGFGAAIGVPIRDPGVCGVPDDAGRGSNEPGGGWPGVQFGATSTNCAPEYCQHFVLHKENTTVK
jgi:hypothetical protein